MIHITQLLWSVTLSLSLFLSLQPPHSHTQHPTPPPHTLIEVECDQMSESFLIFSYP